VEVVFLERQHGIDLLHLQRNSERNTVVDWRQLLARGLENGLARALARFEIAPVPDSQHQVDERVVRVTICNHVVIRTVRTHAHTTDREHARRQRCIPQCREETREVELPIEVRGVFDEDVRHRSASCFNGRQ